jgi:hypothetical protein
VDVQAAAAGAVDDDPEDVFVLAGLLQQLVKHAQVRT